MTLLLWASAAIAADCDAAAKTTALESAALEGRSEDAKRLQSEAEAAFACGPTAEPALVARMFLAEAVVAQLANDGAGVDDALIGALNASPTTWNADFGPTLQAKHAKLRATPRGAGTLVLDPVPPGWLASVDGKPTVFPASLPEGLHLAQVGPTAAAMQFAKVIMVIPSETTRVQTTGLRTLPTVAETAAPPAPVAPVPSPAPATGKKPLGLLIAGGISALGAAGAAGGALAQNGAMDQAETVSDLDAAFGLQKGLAATSYTLIAVSVASVGVWVAW